MYRSLQGSTDVLCCPAKSIAQLRLRSTPISLSALQGERGAVTRVLGVRLGSGSGVVSRSGLEAGSGLENVSVLKAGSASALSLGSGSAVNGEGEGDVALQLYTTGENVVEEEEEEEEVMGERFLR